MMNRRKALENIGMSLGYVVTVPTLISIVQSCKGENSLHWTPVFFTPEQALVLTHLVDIILPKTDTPAATEIKVDIFVDKFISEVMGKEEQDLIKIGMDKFINKALKTSQAKNITAIEPEDIEPILASTLKKSKEQQKAYQKIIENHLVENKAPNTLSTAVACYALASTIRRIVIFGYKTSEYIGEQVLAYLPIPSKFIACDDIDKLTGGKAWSLME